MMEKDSKWTLPVTQSKEKTAVKLPEVQLTDKIKLIISTKAYVKISYLVQKIHDVEWSALLFHTSRCSSTWIHY